MIAEKGKETFYETKGFKVVPHEFCGSGNAGVEGQVMLPDIILQQGIELLQGADGIHVQRIDETLLSCPPVSLRFSFAGAIP